MELKEEEDDDWDDDQAAPLPTLPQKQEEHCAPWQRTGQHPHLTLAPTFHHQAVYSSKLTCIRVKALVHEQPGRTPSQ